MQVFARFAGSSHRLDRYACQFLQPAQIYRWPDGELGRGDGFPSRLPRSDASVACDSEEAPVRYGKMVFEQEVAETVRVTEHANVRSTDIAETRERKRSGSAEEVSHIAKTLPLDQSSSWPVAPDRDWVSPGVNSVRPERIPKLSSTPLCHSLNDRKAARS